MKKYFGASITLGFALFAMFFGAGNLILPPFIGLQSGQEWPMAIAGFFSTGIIAPFLGVLTVVLYGNNFVDLGRRIHPVVVSVLGLLIMLCIGPLVAIPRTGATTFEVGILPIVPGFNKYVFAVLFFTIVYFFSASKSKIVDIIGNVLTPLLILSLGLLVIVGMVSPFASSVETQLSQTKSFVSAFHEGYQTLDVLASVIFAGIIIAAAKQKGFDTPISKFRVTLSAGFISMLALLFIYGGLIFLGAHSGISLSENLSRTELLLQISRDLLGSSGTYVISIAVAFACLTTAIALSSAMGSFAEEFTKGKIPYWIGVLTTCLVSAFFSVQGVDEIIEYAVVILGFVYPITFTLILTLLLFGKFVFSKLPFLIAIAVSTILALLAVLEHFGVFSKSIESFRSSLPLYEHSLEWVIPSFVAFLIALLIRGKNQKVSSERRHD